MTDDKELARWMNDKCPALRCLSDAFPYPLVTAWISRHPESDDPLADLRETGRRELEWVASQLARRVVVK